jgi:CheY-like chemotaxis protein
MIVWIVHTDVAFAYEIKQVLKKEGRKIEVFTSAGDFLQKGAKRKKEKGPLPDLVFIDAELGEAKGTDIYLGFLREQNPLAGKFHFCSAMSYGRFEEIFLSRGIKPPPFVEKSRLVRDIEKILEARSQGEDREKPGPSFVHPLARKKTQELEDLKKQVGDLYYKGVFGKDDIAVFARMAGQIRALAAGLSMAPLAAAAEAMGVVLAKPGLGVARVKKEVRDFLAVLEKAVK